jgi:high affinity sulfate transporter 1
VSGWRLFASARPLTRAGLVRDVLAGVTLAAMNVPQSLGYTRIAGTPIITGLYTLLLPLVAFAAFGSSRYLVVAADSATAAILASGLSGMAAVASDRYVALAGMVALLTAGLLLLARLFRIGFLADFLSQTVLVGFLTGVGFQVGIAMLGDMLGLAVPRARSIEQLFDVFRGAAGIHPPTLALSAAVVAIVLGCRRFAPRVPGPLLAVGGALVASAAFDFAARGIAVIGPVPSGLPRLAWPHVRVEDVQRLLPVAASCFFMIVAQSAATARAYATRHRETLDEDADLVGLSAANAAAAASGAFVVNGSPTQTAMVEGSGGRTQIAHLATAAVVALVLLFLTGPLRFLPHAVLAAIVFTIAVGLVDLRGLRDIGRESPGELKLALATAAMVVLLGVEQGILLAMAFSLMRHVRHSYRPHTAVLVRDAHGQWLPTHVVAGLRSGPGLLIYRFGAALFYANASRFTDEVRMLIAAEPPRWLVIEAGAITNVDYSAAHALRELQRDLAASQVALVLVHVEPHLRADLERHGLLAGIGAPRVFEKLHDALEAIGREGPTGGTA